MAAGIKIAEGYVEFNAKDAAFNQALDRVEKRTRKTQESLDGLAESADKAFDVIADASGARGMVDQLKGLAGAGAAAYDSFKDFAKLFAGGLSLGSGLGAGLNLVSTLVPAVQQLGDVFKSLGEGTSGQKFVEQMRAASASAQSTTAALKGAKQATADLDLEYALKREDYGDRKDRWDHPEKMSAQDRAAWEAYNGSTPKYDEKANYLPDDERKRRDDQIAKLRAAALAASARVEFLSHRDNLHAAATQRLNEENPGWDKAFDHSAQAQAKRGARLTKIMQQLVNEAQEQAFETAARLVEAGNELESQNVQAFRAGSDPAQQQAREAFQQAQRKGESDQIDAQEARDRAQHPERFRGSVRVGPMDGEIPESEASAQAQADAEDAYTRDRAKAVDEWRDHKRNEQDWAKAEGRAKDFKLPSGRVVKQPDWTTYDPSDDELGWNRPKPGGGSRDRGGYWITPEDMDEAAEMQRRTEEMLDQTQGQRDALHRPGTATTPEAYEFQRMSADQFYDAIQKGALAKSPDQVEKERQHEDLQKIDAALRQDVKGVLGEIRDRIPPGLVA